MKRPYTRPQGASRRWFSTTMSAEKWREVLELADAFLFLFAGEPESWPAVRH